MALCPVTCASTAAATSSRAQQAHARQATQLHLTVLAAKPLLHRELVVPLLPETEQKTDVDNAHSQGTGRFASPSAFSAALASQQAAAVAGDGKLASRALREQEARCSMAQGLTSLR